MKTDRSHPSLIPKQWQIPQIFRDRLGADPGKQRIMAEEGHYLIILHRAPSAADRGNREAALFWINENSEWKSTPHGGGVNGLIEHIKEYENLVKGLEEGLELPHSSENADLLHEIHDEVTPLLRASRHMLNVLQELRQLFPENRKILLLRDSAINVERSSELLLTDTKSTLDFMLAQSSMKQAQEAHNATIEANKLNRLAAFFFPIITICAVLSIEDPAAVLSRPSTYGIVLAGLLLGLTLITLLRSKR